MSTDLDRQLEIAWSLLELHLQGLGEDEAFWEPAPGAWTIRSGVPDWVVPEPSPCPPATIAWHLWQLAAFLLWSAGGAPSVEEVPWSDTAAAAIARIRELRPARPEAWVNFEVIKQTAEIGSMRRLFASRERG